METTYPHSTVIGDVLGPDDIADIAEEALQAFFTVVCQRLDDYYPEGKTTGDEDPFESMSRARIARGWVNSHALNHPSIAAANE